MADLHPIAICIRPTSYEVIKYVSCYSYSKFLDSMMYFIHRAAQPKVTEDIARQILDKGRRIEQEFAEYYTGTISLVWSFIMLIVIIYVLQQL